MLKTPERLIHQHVKLAIFNKCVFLFFFYSFKKNQNVCVCVRQTKMVGDKYLNCFLHLSADISPFLHHQRSVISFLLTVRCLHSLFSFLVCLLRILLTSQTLISFCFRVLWVCYFGVSRLLVYLKLHQLSLFVCLSVSALL